MKASQVKSEFKKALNSAEICRSYTGRLRTKRSGVRSRRPAHSVVSYDSFPQSFGPIVLSTAELADVLFAR